VFWTFRELRVCKKGKVNEHGSEFLRLTLWAKDGDQEPNRLQMGSSHAVRFRGRMGHARSPLVALIPSIFVHVASSWPKTYYKKGPPVGHEGRWRRDQKHRNRESVGCRRRRLEEEMPSQSSPEGSFIPPLASPSTPLSRSAPLHHHLLQDLIIPTIISWQTWCMTQYTRFPWSIVFLCTCLSSNLLLAIVKFFVDRLHTSLLSSMMVLCTDIWVHTYVGGCIRLSPLHILTGGWTDGVQKPCSNPRCLLC
jgi:hypothetical protein